MKIEQPPIPDIRLLRSGLSLSEKNRIIQGHIEKNHFGERRIPTCMLHDGAAAGEVRRWREEDFVGQSIPRFRCNRPGEAPRVTSSDWMNNENSTSFSGEYLLSQVQRYRVTGDRLALVQCGRALSALQAIANLAGPRRFGWLCKPFGEKEAPESSPDQNLCAVAGLWAFLPHANKTQAAWIKKMIPAVASYWESISYTIDFGDHVWDIRGDIAHMRVFWVINLLAYKLTGDGAFTKIAQRLEKESGGNDPENVTLFDAFRKSDPQYFANWRIAGEFAGATLLFVSLITDMLCELQPRRRVANLLKLRRALEHGLIGLDETLLGHYFQHEVKSRGGEYLWRPVTGGQPDAAAHYRMQWGNLALHEYTHRLFWMDGTSRLPMAYLTYLKHGGAVIPNIERIVREIMSRLDFQRIHWMVDFNHDQLAPELEYMRPALTSEIANYVLAYWLGEALNFWDARDSNRERRVS